MKIKKTLVSSLIVVGFILFSSAIVAQPELLDPSCKAEAKKATDAVALENKADNGASNAKMQAGIQACLQKSLSQTCAQQLKSKSYSAVGRKFAINFFAGRPECLPAF